MRNFQIDIPNPTTKKSLNHETNLSERISILIANQEAEIADLTIARDRVQELIVQCNARIDLLNQVKDIPLR